MDEKKILKYSLYFIIFGAMISRGAFFTTWLTILNLYFVILIISLKKPLKLDLNAILFIVIFLLAFLSTVFSDSNIGIAIEELVKYSLFPLSYIAFVNIDDKVIVERVFYRSIVFLSAAGLLAIAGLQLMPDMVIKESGRLQSFLQYANTTAMLLSAGIFIAVNNYISTRKKSDILAGIVMFTALVFTKSRIGFWVFIAVAVLYLIVKSKSKVRIYAISALIAIIVGISIIGNRIILVSIFEPTFVERLLTFNDAFSILKRNIFGIGMGAWQFKQLQLQSAPYFVRYIHSVYFQIALDCGVFGLICFLAALVNSVIKGLINKSVYVFIIILIAVGSLVEVNFSFGIVIIFYTFIMSNIETKQKSFAVNKSVRLLLFVPVLAFSLLLISEFAIIYGKLNRASYERAITSYNVAKAINPFNYRVYMDMAKVESNPHNMLSLLEQGYEENPIDRSFVAEITEGYNYVQNYEKALVYAKRFYELHKYSAESQYTYELILHKAYNAGAITENIYNSSLSDFFADVENANAKINPMYRYVNPQMEYSR